MFTTANSSDPLAAFAPISLEALNAKASMLERLDNKYVVTAETLNDCLPELLETFDALEIGGVRHFTYDTSYYDSRLHECYRHHHQGRRRRCKVRVRNYREARLTFLEVKLKDKRGQTVKRRMKIKEAPGETLTSEQQCFVGYCYRDLYGEPLPLALAMSLQMTYRRATLVARSGGERMTIDSGLTFRMGDETREIDSGIAVIETKSRNGNGLADKVLRRHHQHPANRCSKYCTGIAMLNETLPRNKFKNTMLRLGWRVR